MEERCISVALIGCGRAGMIHAHNFHGRVPNAKITAVADISEEAARAAAAALSISAFYTDYRELLKKEPVDAVIVVSPTHLHHQIVLDCAKAKKHILCEKPMAMTVSECEDMIACCRENGVKLQLGFMRRHDKSFQRAKESLERGDIGELVQIHSCTRGPSKPRPWMYDLKASNGILAEVNSHDIDAVRWFAGSEIDKLYAVGGNYRNPEATAEYPDYYDSVLMSGTFQNGVQFVIDGAAYVQYGYDAKMELVGTKGVIHVGRAEADSVTVTNKERGIATPFINSWMTLFEQAYQAEDESFVNAILYDKEPSVTGLDGLMAVKIVNAGSASIQTGEIVKMGGIEK